MHALHDTALLITSIWITTDLWWKFDIFRSNLFFYLVFRRTYHVIERIIYFVFWLFLIKKYQRFNKGFFFGVPPSIFMGQCTNIFEMFILLRYDQLVNFAIFLQNILFIREGRVSLKGSMHTLYLNFIWNTRLKAINLLIDMLERPNHLRWRNFSMATNTPSPIHSFLMGVPTRWELNIKFEKYTKFSQSRLYNLINIMVSLIYY